MTATKLALGHYLELQGPPIEVAEAARYIRVTVKHTLAQGPFQDYALDALPPAITHYAYRAAARKALSSYAVTITFLDGQVSHIV